MANDDTDLPDGLADAPPAQGETVATEAERQDEEEVAAQLGDFA